MTIERTGITRAKLVLAVFLFLFIFIMISAPGARAQEGSRLDIFGGYSYLRFDSRPLGFQSDSNLNGFIADFTGNINLKWAVTLGASGHYGNELSIYNFLIGPQYSFRRDKSRFFIHGLFGKAHDNVDIPSRTFNDLLSVGRALGGGGGFDYDRGRLFSIRVFQADFIHTNTYKIGKNDYRVSTGVVFHIGHIGHRRRL